MLGQVLPRSAAVAVALASFACSKKQPEPTGTATDAAVDSETFGLTFVPPTTDAAWTSSPGCDYGEPERCTSECDRGNHGSCANLAMMLIAGHGITADPRRGRDLLEHSCAQNDPMSCSNLAQVYENGWGVERDLRRAADLYERACDHDFPPACGNLGVLVGRGTGRARDPSRARALLSSACTRGDANACENLRTMPP